MLFVDTLDWSEFARIDPPSTLQMVILFFVALVLTPVLMQLFSRIFRFAFILTAVAAPVYIMMPMLQ
ncbi:MAG: hypothetical protein ACJ8AW_28135 [Rhodopila sp.]